MPKASDIKTQSGNGALYATRQPATGGVVTSTDQEIVLRDIIGDNLGEGHGVYAGTNVGAKFVTMEFRSITAGPGIRIDGDKDTIVIESTGVITTDLSQMVGLLPASKGGTGKQTFAYNSLLLGNGGNPLQEFLPPDSADKVLRWNGVSYEWASMPNLDNIPSGTVKSVNVTAGSNMLSFTGGPITSSGSIVGNIVESNIPINNLNGTLQTSKGGTGNATFLPNTLLVGNGTGALLTTPQPSMSGQVLTWSGSNFSWAAPSSGVQSVNVLGNNGISATANSSGGATTLNISLSPTGISSGSYTNPTLTVDSYGRVISITSATPVNVGGQNLGNSGQGLYSGKVGDDLAFKRIEEGTGISVTSSATAVNVGINLVPLNKGGTGSSNLTNGSLTYVGSDKFYSIVSAPTGTTSLLGYDGTAYRWYNIPGTTAISSATDDLSISSTNNGSITSYSITLRPENIQLNELGGLLDSYKGGTGRSSFPVNSLLMGNGTNAMNYVSVPLTPNTFLAWNGASYEWKAVATSGGGITSLTAGAGLTTTANSSAGGGTITSAGSLHIANTGVTAGTYKLLSATVSATGQITSAVDAEERILTRSNHIGTMSAEYLSGSVSVANGGTGLTSAALAGNANKYMIVNEAGNGYTFVMPSQYILPSASKTVLGGVKVGDSLGIDANGVLNVDSIKYEQITNPPSLFSGYYDDLMNKPTVFSGLYEDLVGAPALVTVATTGKYSDLVGTPSLSPVASSGQYSDLAGTPSLALVATSGSYNDLADKPNLALVATTGKYSDLTGTPTIATADTAGLVKLGSGVSVDENGALVINASGLTSVGLTSPDNSIVTSNNPLTENGLISVTVNPRVISIGSLNGDLEATRVTGLANVARTGEYGDLVGAPALAPVATSGSYSDLANVPTLSRVATTGYYTDLIGAPALATVANTGSYGDLVDTPDLATFVTTDALSGLVTETEFNNLARVAFTGSYNDLTDKPSAPGGEGSSYTDAQARAAISVTGDLVYDTNTGIISYTTPAIPSVEGLASTTYVDQKVASAVIAAGSFTGDYNDLSNKPDLSTVALTGSYNDLSDKPVIPEAYTDAKARASISVTGNGTYDSATGVITINSSTGSFSGSYNDLTDKPAIPSIDGLATTAYVDGAVSTAVDAAMADATFDYSDLVNAPQLSTVATSGSYNDLTDKPVIPAAYTDAQARAAISVTGDLTYDAVTGVITYTAPSGGVSSGSYNDLTDKPVLATVATSGSYDDLTNKPVIPTLPTLASVATSGSYNDLVDKPVIPTLPTLATVATTGQYSDLQGLPSIPSVEGLASTTYVDQAVANVSGGGVTSYNDLTDKPVFATVATTGSYSDLLNKPVIPAAYTDAQARAAISVAGNGTYNSSTGVITINGSSFSGAYSDLTGTPTFATVATTGSYNDLVDKPTIMTQAQVRSSITLNSGLSGASYSAATGVLDLSTLNLGEYNTATSVGTGISLTAGKVGPDLRFKSIKAGTGISLAEESGTIVINSSVVGGEGSALVVQKNGVLVSAPNTINFTGAGVTVSDVGGVTTVDIPGAAAVGASASSEWVELKYTAGTGGNLTGTGAISATSTNLVAEVVDGAACTIKVTIKNRDRAPSSIWVYGYNCNNLYWTGQVHSPAVGPMTLRVEGATAASDVFASGVVDRIITMDVTFVGSGAVGKALTRARALVVFGY